MLKIVGLYLCPADTPCGKQTQVMPVREGFYSMNLNFYEFDALEKELEGLPPLHRVAFAASCCERLLPNYNAFYFLENWGDPSVLRTALNEVWQIL